jgi:hypothetical protein
VKTTLRIGTWLAGMIGMLLLASPAPTAQGESGPTDQEVQALVDRAAAFFKVRQSADGSFSAKLGGPGISALVAAGLIRNGTSPDEPMLAKTLRYLESRVQPDGGVYDRMLANYTTSVALLAFQEANTGGKYDTVIKNATRFLKTLPFDEAKVPAGDVRFGGVGYDAKSRPDLSNTQFFLEALLSAGVSKDDPAVKRALTFVGRCQNLPGEFNDQPFAKKATADDKGGFVYTPVLGEQDAARAAEEGLRSAGVMTYAGLKSFLHAGVSKDDPRVRAAVGWIRAHYTLEENPGQGARGLYYYYHTFGKAMAALGEDTFTDAAGKKHLWRRELFEALKKQQQRDGSWVNDQSQAFMEGNPDLATAYAVLTLSYCRPGKR